METPAGRVKGAKLFFRARKRCLTGLNGFFCFRNSITPGFAAVTPPKARIGPGGARVVRMPDYGIAVVGNT